MLSRSPVLEPVNDANIEILPGLVRGGSAQRRDDFVIPRFFLGELGYMRSLIVDDFKEVTIPISKKDAILIPERQVADRSICYIALDMLCSRMSWMTIVQTVSILLLEKQVVFVAKSVHFLSLCVLCLRSLCRPFRFRGTYLSVLPSGPDFVGVLDSPVPFVCGIVKRTDMPEIPSHVVVIDLDGGVIRDPEMSPLLPQGTELVATLDSLIKRQRGDIEIPGPDTPRHRTRSLSQLGTRRPPPAAPPVQSPPPKVPDQRTPEVIIEFIKKRRHPLILPWHYMRYQRRYIFGPVLVGEIVDLFRRHLAPRLDQLIRPCFITDTTDIDNPVTVFNRELFLASVPPKERPFYEAFVATTSFTEFAEGRMEENETISRSAFSSPCLSALQASEFDPDELARAESYNSLPRNK
jgi:hypothetical protein